MLDILRDPIWQFIVGIITLIVTVWLAARTYSKRISYEIIAKTSLVNVASTSDKSRIRIFFDKKQMNYPAASGRGIAPLKQVKLLDM